MDYQNTKKQNPFVTASLVTGVLAFATIMTGVFPLFFGGLSILFAVLSHRKGKRLETSSFIGVIGSTVGIAFSTVLLVITFSLMPTLLRTPEYREYMNNMSESMYGITFDEMLEEGYGIDLDKVLGIE